jgi:hypothetical protein
MDIQLENFLKVFVKSWPKRFTIVVSLLRITQNYFRF